jgi:signal transduction histidine kinase
MDHRTRQPGASSQRRSRRYRVGLQAKSALMLTIVIVCLTGGGGWFYFRITEESLRSSDHLQASRLAGALALSACDGLRQKNIQSLHRLVSDMIHNDSVRNVALLDADGKVVATAGQNDFTADWRELQSLPVSVADTRQCRENILTLAAPVLTRDERHPQVVGAVRMLVDTNSTRLALARVQQSLVIIAGAIIGGWLLLGNLLVWRVVIRPVRMLAAATVRLGQGDFSVRAKFRGNDEISDLAGAFDTMAGQIARGREELIQANEQLESKVAQRTRDLQATNERLRQEMAEKEDFLRAVSHDLGAPLRNIAGMAMMAMMKYGPELPEEVRLRLQRIQANVETENALIGELLELSRITTRPQRRQMVDIGLLMEELGRMFEYELRKGGITLAVDKRLPCLCVEKSRVRQVFQNLIDNAIKYMDKPTGGRIEIGYSRQDGMHRFSVIDNGPGVPEDQWQQIFYVFRRATSAAIAKVPGRGVGLALVKAVASIYDGRSWVEAAPSGQGAAFYVELSEARTSGQTEEVTHDIETCDSAGR